jgi:arabinosyltransferase
MPPARRDTEEAAPLHTEPVSSPSPPCGAPAAHADERRGMRRSRTALALCSACLALAVASSGLALWRGTGRAVWAWQTDVRSVQGAVGGPTRDIGPSKDACAARRAAPSPPTHVAATEWWFSMVAPYADSPARDDAVAALRAQDAAEAAAAAARWACAEDDDDRNKPSPRPFTGDPADFQLSPSLLAALVGPPTPGAPITVTWCNAAFLPFALNWAAHARAAGLAPFAIGAADPAALEGLLAAGLPAFAMPGAGLSDAGQPPPSSSSSDAGWGTPAFHALGRSKAALAAALTGLGYDVLLCDVDTAWLADPRPFLARWPAAAVLTSWDGLARTGGQGQASQPAVPPNATGLAAAIAAVALPPSEPDSLEAWPAAAGAPANIGVMLWRATAHPVAVAWRDALLAEPGAWDQDVFNDLLTAGGDVNGSSSTSSAANNGLFRAFGRAAPNAAASLAGVLPVDAFASGHTFFIQRLAERTGAGTGAAPITPFVVHTTFQFSGSAGKRHRLRERWLWAVDGPDHYAPAGGLLTLGDFEADDPAFGALLARAVPRTLPPDSSTETALSALAGHFDLVHRQLRSIGAGLALAAALNRTLVLPRLWCGADRWWQPFLGGSIPGTARPARLPFRCPADHVLDLAAMGDGGRRLDARHYGPPIPFREAGLLLNPRFPAAHRAPGPGGTLTVVVGGGEGNTSTTTTLSIPPGLDDAGLRAALAPVASTPVLHFPDPAAAMAGGFVDPGDAARFARRLAASTDLWCCVPGAEPGHVWYDAAAGSAHIDRHGRAWAEGEWVPMTGP